MLYRRRHSPACFLRPSGRQGTNPKLSRGGPNAVPRSFAATVGRGAGANATGLARLLKDLQITARLVTRAAIHRRRLDREQTRTDMRDWAQERRARTRHLIELGGLVQKAGLVELADDDRATLLGAFLDIADRLRGSDDTGDDPRHLATRWRRRGLRTFEADCQAAAEPDEQAVPALTDAKPPCRGL